MDEIILFHFKHHVFGLKVPAFRVFIFQLIKVCGYKRSRDWERLRKLPKKKYIVYCMCSHTLIHASLAREYDLLLTKQKYILYKERELFSGNFLLLSKKVSAMREKIYKCKQIPQASLSICEISYTEDKQNY